MSHTESLEKEIKKFAALFISQESNRTSLITITRCEISSDGKRAVLYVSVLPNSAEAYVVDFLKRRQDDVRGYIKSHSRIGAVPWIRFIIDNGEKNRPRVTELLQENEE